MILEVKRSLYDAYKTPSQLKIEAYNNIIQFLNNDDGTYIVYTKGNSFNFSVTAINLDKPLVKHNNDITYEALRFTKTKCKRTTVTIYYNY